MHNRAVRAIFFEAEDAEAVAARLRADGYAATITRDRFAGEDDDEDHPYAVASDAPAWLLELLIDDHDGWLDTGTDEPETEPPSLPPLRLPDAPKRLKRPPGTTRP